MTARALEKQAFDAAKRAYHKTYIGDYGPLYGAIQAYVETASTTQDPLVQSVMSRMASRSEQGMKTYGVPMTREDVSTVEWLRHAQEEALDLAVYLERIIRDLSDNTPNRD